MDSIPTSTMLSPEQRFSDRVENYVRYRPHYPVEIIPWLTANAGLKPDSWVADIGSGTGISSDLFLQSGCKVWAIEPNQEMRAAAEAALSANVNFHSVAGSAQATTLPDHSMDFVVAAQAFHWFNTEATRREFTRILKPSGKAILLWNERLLDTTSFLRDYEALLNEFGTDYATIRHENIDEAALTNFFIGSFRSQHFANHQRFDLAGLTGRLLSSSYAPAPGHPRHGAMMVELERIFTRYQQDGQVQIDYRTVVYVGE
jgi:SAM-dependent methyltransferase